MFIQITLAGSKFSSGTLSTMHLIYVYTELYVCMYMYIFNSLHPTSGTPPVIPSSNLVHPISGTAPTDLFHSTSVPAPVSLNFAIIICIKWAFLSVHSNLHTITFSIIAHNYAAFSLVIQSASHSAFCYTATSLHCYFSYSRDHVELAVAWIRKCLGEVPIGILYCRLVTIHS